MQQNDSLISGLGLMTCGEFMAAKQANHWSYEANLQWILGYASAMNQVAYLRNEPGRFGDDIEWEPIAEWLDAYSSAHPDHLVADAAELLYATFNAHAPTVH